VAADDSPGSEFRPRGTLRIRGAVLEEIGASAPYAQSRPIRIDELSADPPGQSECLVQIQAAGVCHSDLSVVNGNRPRPVPMLLGHEACGRIVETGSEVDELHPGDRVVMTFLPRCQDCAGCRTQGRIPCEVGSARNGAGELLAGGRRLRRGSGPVHHHLGVSAFADFAVVDHRSLVRIPDDVPPEIGALLGCAVLTGGGAVWNAVQPAPGSRLIVLGLGGVGMAALLTALAEPDVEVIGVDPIASKCELALELGASAALSPQQALAEGVRADAVIEASGHPDALGSGIALLATGGVLAATGLAAPNVTTPLPTLRLVAEALTIQGCYLGSSLPQRDIPRFVERWRQGLLPLERLISHRIELQDINLAMDRLHDGQALRQIIIAHEQ